MFRKACKIKYNIVTIFASLYTEKEQGTIILPLGTMIKDNYSEFSAHLMIMGKKHLLASRFLNTPELDKAQVHKELQEKVNGMLEQKKSKAKADNITINQDLLEACKRARHNAPSRVPADFNQVAPPPPAASTELVG